MALYGQQPVYQPMVQQQPYNYPYNYIPNTQQPVQQQVTKQDNGIIPVHSKEEAQYFPVGPGNTVTFRKDDGSAMYVKTASFSTTEPFIFEEYERVKPKESEENQNEIDYKAEFDKLWGEVNALKRRSKRREDGEDRHA